MDGLFVIEQGEIKLVTISPVTSQALKKLGIRVAAEAKQATTKGVIEALIELCVV